jgi:hypothetical protein
LRNRESAEGLTQEVMEVFESIHAMLVETGFNIVFHGHDHSFAYQKLDGIVYQLVPKPAHRNRSRHSAEEYNYKEGAFLPNSGACGHG